MSGRSLGTWALRVILGLLFAAIGYTKLSGTGNTIEYFAAIGWGQWFRYLTGSMDIVGAVLLFVPQLTRYGALLLTCSVGLATLISLTVLRGNPTWGRPDLVVVPLIITLLTVLLGWLTRAHRRHDHAGT